MGIINLLVALRRIGGSVLEKKNITQHESLRKSISGYRTHVTGSRYRIWNMICNFQNISHRCPEILLSVAKALLMLSSTQLYL